MTGQLLIWMVILLGIIFGGFVYFANIAANNEKTK